MAIGHVPFEALTIGPLTLRNRFIKAATNEGMAKGGIVSRGLSLFHERMAKGGVGMTTVAYCAVSRDGRTFIDQVVLDRNSLDDLKAMTTAIHREGGAICAQLTHAGSFTFLPKSELATDKPLTSSGGFNKVGMLSKRWFKQAMNRQQMDDIADEFVIAARLAREAGFDAVELHMGHGYLLSQFVSPVYNKRRDAYGGTIEKRMTYPVEVLTKVLDAVGKELAVLVKFSMTDGVSHGNQIGDGIAIARSVAQAGAHMAVLSNGLNVESVTATFGSPLPATSTKAANPIVGLGMKVQRMTAPKNVVFHENYLQEKARRIRAATDMPLAYLGGIQSFDGVEQAMTDGFDAIAMGRILIHDPQIIDRWKNGSHETSGCTTCNQCVTMMYMPSGTHCILTGAQDPKLNLMHAGAAA
ncbi:NADH:flavin oxidoreductase [Croceicoccus sp. F390]|uniref:NADH:flavin oxidoreductase n=1 Tax=Croceicoccus esteveae TaxID=3075597 RepID=A0ABU2ZES0_9SPHN|nr:NADH:flavin oxidoreductase [Croceicoccus sp. F390]MDT0574578.1 NADH:flavin oxidoreductase [Croceicoccus sp. F390]